MANERFSADDPLVRAMIQERLNQMRAQTMAMQGASKPQGGGSMWAAAIPPLATIGGLYAGRELFGGGGGSSAGDSGGSGFWGNLLGRGVSGGGGSGGGYTPSDVDTALPGFSWGGGGPVATTAMPGMGESSAAIQGVAPEVGGAGALSGALPYALPAAAAAAGGYGLYDMLKNSGDRSQGRNIAQGALSGLALGGPIGAVASGVWGGLRGGAEHPEAADRGRIANQLEEAGVISDLDKGQYNIDPAQNNLGTATGQLVGAVNPAAAIAAMDYAQSPEEFAKLSSDTAGMMASKLQNSGNPTQDIKAMYDKLGGRDQVYGKISLLASQGLMDQQAADAAHAAIDLIYGVRNKNAPKEDQARFDAYQKGQSLESMIGGSQPAQTPVGATPGGAPMTTAAPQWQPLQQSSLNQAVTPAIPTRPGVVPGQSPELAARKTLNREPIDMAVMDLDPQFAGIFQDPRAGASANDRPMNLTPEDIRELEAQGNRMRRPKYYGPQARSIFAVG